MTPRDALQFVAAEIMSEADRSGIRLTDTERRMLFFDETASNARMIEAMEAFERECDAKAYEEKIAKLIESARKRADPAKAVTWNAAVKTLARTDAYLGVMLDKAGPGSAADGVSWRTGFGLLLVCALWGLAAFGLARIVTGRPPDDQEVSYYGWLLAVIAGVGYVIARWLLGADRVDRPVEVVFGLLFGNPKRR